MTIVILVICAANLLLVAYGVTLIERGNHMFSEEVDENVSPSDQTVTDLLTVDEHVALREQAHDERIRQMKDELARQNFPSNTLRNTDTLVTAQELDPNVKNLPHSIVDGHYGRSLTEVSE